jgi:hypothetical protein
MRIHGDIMAMMVIHLQALEQDRTMVLVSVQVM